MLRVEWLSAAASDWPSWATSISRVCSIGTRIARQQARAGRPRRAPSHLAAATAKPNSASITAIAPGTADRPHQADPRRPGRTGSPRPSCPRRRRRRISGIVAAVNPPSSVIVGRDVGERREHAAEADGADAQRQPHLGPAQRAAAPSAGRRRAVGRAERHPAPHREHRDQRDHGRPRHTATASRVCPIRVVSGTPTMLATVRPVSIIDDRPGAPVRAAPARRRPASRRRRRRRAAARTRTGPPSAPVARRERGADVGDGERHHQPQQHASGAALGRRGRRSPAPRRPRPAA